MNLEKQPPPIAEVAPAGRLTECRCNQRRIIAVTLGVLALSFTAGARSAEDKPTSAKVPAVPLAAVKTSQGEVSPAKWTGVLEDAAKQPSELAAAKKMQLLDDLVQAPQGQPSNVYVKESIWASPGQVGPSEEDFIYLENSIKAAQAYGYQVCLAVWPFTWGKGKDHLPPPLSPSKRWQYTTLLATIDGRLRQDFHTPPGEDGPVSCWFIGNEPNNPTFWRPQFAADGTEAAAKAYEQLLARSYDTLKKVSPDYMVIGGELSSHGNDDPHSRRPSVSPELFIKDLGKAYRDSGRTKPIMDIFGYHPYGLSSAESPDTPHPNSTTIGVADYPTLTQDLARAFDGTPQPGSRLPILYSEFGVESQTTGPQAYRYKHAENKSSGAVDEAMQAKYYGQYFRLAACQQNVIGALLFHTADEQNRKGWQSGAYYTDGAPKSSQPSISRSMKEFSGGGIPCS